MSSSRILWAGPCVNRNQNCPQTLDLFVSILLFPRAKNVLQVLLFDFSIFISFRFFSLFAVVYLFIYFFIFFIVQPDQQIKCKVIQVYNCFKA